ncbi:hypothetical protein CHS0354_041083 [Potamilus streckersoni]|uniref:Ataxin-2 C-terminal domain-containing protein n=1 Tax=Potamilus streckersoni TaxID=2493646 RepID=A0AAE0VV14_9BIVA|nr:hypothetical protein CHS0354_041083 [Potamilus streckersoni]
MNMKTPKSLLDDDTEGENVPHMVVQAVEYTEHEWTEDELEDIDRQVQEELWEEAFIEACFDEMLQEEEAQWQYYHITLGGDTIMGGTCPPAVADPLEYTNEGQQYLYVPDSSEQTAVIQVSLSKLNPEAPEFIPRKSWRS